LPPAGGSNRRGKFLVKKKSLYQGRGSRVEGLGGGKGGGNQKKSNPINNELEESLWHKRRILEKVPGKGKREK